MTSSVKLKLLSSGSR